MALLTSIREMIFSWFVPSQRTFRPRRLALQFLEAREVPAVGGGFTAGGILGEYFDNPNLAGTPAFSRQDVRIDFDWQTRGPGGSNSADYIRVGPDNFSVRWSGQLIPRFSETYTFRTTSDDGVRLWIKAAGTDSWEELVHNWDAHSAEENTRAIALTAGRTYDIRMEYHERTGRAIASLTWSSPSTPEEVIDPVVNLGVNAVTYDFHLYADAAKSGRAEWGDPQDYFGRPLVASDKTGSPMADAGHIFWEGQDPNKTHGVYQLRFVGKAEVISWFNQGRFRANGIEYGHSLPLGAGYDPSTNRTIVDVVVNKTDIFGLYFRNTHRTANSASNTGITNVQLMRPLAPGSGSYYRPDELFLSDVKNAFARFTTLRYLTANFNPEREWSERKLPSSLKVAWGDRYAVWENQVALANETGKDLYITIPINASSDYVHRLAKLLRFGSDGENPYDSFVSNPRYSGLNPNLRVYVEWANETWNWAFSQAHMGADAAKAAVHNNTPDGRIVNFDGQKPQGDFRRWTALQTVKASNTFRSIWGTAAMGEHVRMVLGYQYNNVQYTALEALRFIDNYFNNADGQTHVSNPQPVSYYIWGAGGASYFGASNPRGLVEDILVPDGSFESTQIANGASQHRPDGSWAFTGDAGVYRNARGFGENKRIAVANVGAVPTTPSGSQAMFISGNGTATVSIDFPRAGIYALDFRSASEFGNSLANPLDFYFNDTRVTPRAAELAPNPGPWRPGTGYGRDSAKFVAYGTVPVHVTGPGRHTFRIVGRGTDNQTTLIDDVRVASTTAIFASRLPGGGQAAGQVSNQEYHKQLASQARYALAYGLKVVAYEGGWSLGGDTESMPIQSYAKYRDGRAADAMAQAIDAFHQAGGELNVLGTYDQWHLEDSANASDYPLVRGIDLKLRSLPPEPTTGIVIPGTLPVSTQASDATGKVNEVGFVRRSEWVSWNVLAPATGDYRIATSTTKGGQVKLIVDGAPIIDGPSGASHGEVVRLTRGVHNVRVQNTKGEFFIRDITVVLVGTPASTPPHNPSPVSSPTTGLPAGWSSDNIGAKTLSGKTRIENGRWIIQGAGENIWGAADEFHFAHQTIGGDATLVARVESIEDTHGWAKAGLMVRNGTGASAPFAAVYRTPRNGIVFEWRSHYRSAPQSVELAINGPMWLKMIRRGNSFAAYYSTNGETWTRIGEAQTVAMPNSVQAGLAVTSHDVNRRTTAIFTGVSVTD